MITTSYELINFQFSLDLKNDLVLDKYSKPRVTTIAGTMNNRAGWPLPVWNTSQRKQPTTYPNIAAR